jgi:hypothetical protein
MAENREVGALLLCGYGGTKHHLDFAKFARSQVDLSVLSNLIQKVAPDAVGTKDQITVAQRIIANNIKIVTVNEVVRWTKQSFIDEILKFRTKSPKLPIEEFHVFCHSYPDALSLMYEDRDDTISRGVYQNNRYFDPHNSNPRPFRADEVLNREQGMLFSEDLTRDTFPNGTPTLKSQQESVRSGFTETAFVWLWGCNAGIKNHSFKDPIVDMRTRELFSDPVGYESNMHTAVVKTYGRHQFSIFYWRALNNLTGERLSIAQALANYLGIGVYAAFKGSHSETRLPTGEWVNSDTYDEYFVKSGVTDLLTFDHGKIKFVPAPEPPVQLRPDGKQYPYDDYYKIMPQSTL